MCDICGGSGLIPLRRKIDNSIVPFAWTYCECHQDEPEHYHSVRPEDIDYTLSFSHYRALCQEHDWQDPGSDEPPEPELIALKPQEIIHRHSDMSSKDYALLRSLEGQVKYHQQKLTEREKPKAQGKFGYKGIK